LLPKIGAALLGNARRITTQASVFDNNVLAVIPDRIEFRYLFYWLCIKDLAELTNPGPVPSLNDSALLDERPPVGDRAGQAAIADYLDAETARIDALIEKKSRLVDLADAAVTARLEAFLATVDRSIPLRRLLVKPPQYGASQSGEAQEGESWPRYIRITDLEADGTLRSDDVRYLDPVIAQPYMLRDRDVLMARSGATVGKAFIYKESMGPCCFAGYLIRFTFDTDKVLPELVAMWTRTSQYWDEIRQNLVQSTIENVSAERYKDLLMPVPSLSYQEDMVREVEAYRQRADDVRCRLSRQIDLLTEHRQALITAAVAGALQIPGVAHETRRTSV
jgi:restriction endonuclease S subunit